MKNEDAINTTVLENEICSHFRLEDQESVRKMIVVAGLSIDKLADLAGTMIIKAHEPFKSYYQGISFYLNKEFFETALDELRPADNYSNGSNKVFHATARLPNLDDYEGGWPSQREDKPYLRN